MVCCLPLPAPRMRDKHEHGTQQMLGAQPQPASTRMAPQLGQVVALVGRFSNHECTGSNDGTGHECGVSARLIASCPLPLVY